MQSHAALGGASLGGSGPISLAPPAGSAAAAQIQAQGAGRFSRGGTATRAHDVKRLLTAIDRSQATKRSAQVARRAARASTLLSPLPSYMEEDAYDLGSGTASSTGSDVRKRRPTSSERRAEVHSMPPKSGSVIGGGKKPQVDVSLALQWAEQVHPRMQVGDARVPLSVCGTRLGRHCCDLCRFRLLDPCKEGVYSDLEVFGPGVSMLFKDLKCLAIVFLLLGCVSLPHFILNMLLGKGVISPAVLLNTRFTDTMLGNLGGQLLNPLEQNASASSAANGTDFTVLLGSVGICQAITPSSDGSRGDQDTAPWLQETVCNLGDSSIALLYTWIDLIVVAVFALFYLWLRYFQHHEDHLVDRDFATAADFSIYVRGLPAEVDEASIKSHFEVVVGESVSAVSIARDEPEYVRLAAKGGALLTEWEEVAAASAKTVLVQAALRSAGEDAASEPIAIPATASDPSARQDTSSGPGSNGSASGSVATSHTSRASTSPVHTGGMARSSPARSAFGFGSEASQGGKGGPQGGSRLQQGGGSNRSLRAPGSPGGRPCNTATPRGPLRATSPRLQRDDIDVAAELITGVRSRDVRSRVAGGGTRDAVASVHGAVGIHDKETFSEVDARETARLETITRMAATLSGDPLAPARRRLLGRMRKLYKRILRARAMHVGVLADAVRYVDATQIAQADPSLVRAGRTSGWRGMGRPVGAFVTFERQIARRRALKKYANSAWRLSRCLCQARSMRVKPDVSSRMIMKAVNTMCPAVSSKALKRSAPQRRATQWEAIAAAKEGQTSGAKAPGGDESTPPSSGSEEAGGSNRAQKMASLAAKQSIRRMRVESDAASPTPRGTVSRKRSGADMRTESSGGLLSSGVVQVAAVLGGLSSSDDDSDFDDDVMDVLDFDDLGLDGGGLGTPKRASVKGDKGGTSTSNPLAALSGSSSGGSGNSSSKGTSRSRRSVSLNPLSAAITAKPDGERPHSTPHSATPQAGAEGEAAAQQKRSRRPSAALQWSTLAQRRAGLGGSGTGLSSAAAPPPGIGGASLFSRAPSPEQRQRSDGSGPSDLGMSDDSDEEGGVKGGSPEAVHRHATARNRKALRRLSTRWGVDLTAGPAKQQGPGPLEGLPSLSELQAKKGALPEPSLAGDFVPGGSRSTSGSKAFGTTRARRQRGGGAPPAGKGGADSKQAPSDKADLSPKMPVMGPPKLPPPPISMVARPATPSTSGVARYGTSGTTMERHGAARQPGVLADEDSSTSAANKVFDFDTEHQRLGLFTVEVLEASPPYFVQWANLHISWWGRLLRGSLTTILLVGGLSFSFGLAAYTNAALADAAGTAQTAVCPVESVQLTEELLLQDPRLVPCYCKTLSLLAVLSDPLCDEWKVKAAVGLGVTTVSSVTMAVINALLQVVILLLTPFEAHWSKDSEQISLTWRLFVSLFFNTALIQLFVTADLDFIFNTDLGILSVSNGQLFRDLSPGWYQVVGSLLSAVLMFNIVAPHLLPLGQMFLHNLRRKWAIRRPMWECYWPIALCCACDGVFAPCCCGGSNRPVCPGPCGGMCLCSGSCCVFISTCGLCGAMEDVGAVSRRQAHMVSEHGDNAPAARASASPAGSAVVTVASRSDGAARDGVELTHTPSMHSNSMLRQPASNTKAFSVMGALASEASATPEYHLAGMPVRTLDCCPVLGNCTMGCERRWYDYWAPKKQSDLNRVYTGDEFPLVQRYSAILTTVFATFMYSSSMPMLYWLAAVSFIAFVWLDFTLLVTFYRSPLHFSARPGVALAGLLPLALVLHFVFAAMAYSNEEIFPVGADESSVTVGGASVPVSQVGKLAEEQAGSVSLLQRLSRPHVLPLVVAMLLVLLFEVAVRGVVYLLDTCRRQGFSLTKTRESQLPPYSQLLKQNKISGVPSYNFLESAELAERIHVPDHFTEHFASITDVLLYQSRRIEQIAQWSGVELNRDKEASGKRRRRRLRKKDADDE